MVSVTEYKCTNCGLKFYDDGRCFYYDEELNQTVDFIITFITANWGGLNQRLKERLVKLIAVNVKNI